jgi:hypothetical protein
MTDVAKAKDYKAMWRALEAKLKQSAGDVRYRLTTATSWDDSLRYQGIHSAYTGILGEMSGIENPPREEEEESEE